MRPVRCRPPPDVIRLPLEVAVSELAAGWCWSPSTMTRMRWAACRRSSIAGSAATSAWSQRTQGSSGLAELEALKVDGADVAVVLADQWMPGLSGSELPTACADCSAGPAWPAGRVGRWAIHPPRTPCSGHGAGAHGLLRAQAVGTTRRVFHRTIAEFAHGGPAARRLGSGRSRRRPIRTSVDARAAQPAEPKRRALRVPRLRHPTGRRAAGTKIGKQGGDGEPGAHEGRSEQDDDEYRNFTGRLAVEVDDDGVRCLAQWTGI